MAKHAELSPSGAVRWIACPGSVEASRGLPDKNSEHSKEGTGAHELGELMLRAATTNDTSLLLQHTASNGVPFTDEMVAYVKTYADLVLEYAKGHTLLIEQAVPIGHITGEEGATGTADAVIVTADGEEVIVIDLKYGFAPVEAERNPQLMMYALGAIEKFGDLVDFKRARMVIVQPRLRSKPSEWDCTIEELEQFHIEASTAAVHARTRNDVFVPGVKQCKWCKVKDTEQGCKAFDNLVAQEVVDADFEDLTVSDLEAAVFEAKESAFGADVLAKKLAAVDLIEDWCKAVRASAFRQLNEGKPLPGFKLVQGRAGNRKWEDEAHAEEALKAMRLKKEEMYEFKLISPTTAEKLLADNPRKWKKVEPLITRNDGSLAIAPESDKREAVVVEKVEDLFEPIPDEKQELALDDLL